MKLQNINDKENIHTKGGRENGRDSKDLANAIVGAGKFKILRAGQRTGNPGKN